MWNWCICWKSSNCDDDLLDEILQWPKYFKIKRPRGQNRGSPAVTFILSVGQILPFTVSRAVQNSNAVVCLQVHHQWIYTSIQTLHSIALLLLQPSSVRLAWLVKPERPMARTMVINCFLFAGKTNFCAVILQIIARLPGIGLAVERSRSRGFNFRSYNNYNIRSLPADGSFVLQAPIGLSSSGATGQAINFRSRAFPVADPKTWGALTEDVTSSQSEYTFRRQLKMWLFKKSFPDIIVWYWLHPDL